MIFSCASPLPVPPQTSTPQTADAVLAAYRHADLHDHVVDYFSRLTKDARVAQAVLEACDELDLSPALAFAMAWNESRFNPKAVNYNPTSVDRGLFQLNSKTFRTLRDSVWDPKINTRIGLKFLKETLERTGEVSDALSFYNSGIEDAQSQRLPRSTRVYISKVIQSKEAIDRGLVTWLYFSNLPQLNP